MATEIQTARVRRTRIDRLKLWHRAYETKIFDEHRELLVADRRPRDPKKLPKGDGSICLSPNRYTPSKSLNAPVKRWQR